MRFRFLLPLMSVLLGVVLFRLGDLQVRKAVVEAGGAPEGMRMEVAQARYVDYALNAPAWVIVREEHGMLWSPSTYFTGQDLRYFIAVIVMWYLIGLLLDKRVGRKKSVSEKPRPGLRRILALACSLYGLWICFSQVPDIIQLVRYIKSYGWPNLRWSWFMATVLAWGLGLILAGLFSLFRGKRGKTGQVSPAELSGS